MQGTAQEGFGVHRNLQCKSFLQRIAKFCRYLLCKSYFLPAVWYLGIKVLLVV